MRHLVANTGVCVRTARSTMNVHGERAGERRLRIGAQAQSRNIGMLMAITGRPLRCGSQRSRSIASSIRRTRRAGGDRPAAAVARPITPVGFEAVAAPALDAFVVDIGIGRQIAERYESPVFNVAGSAGLLAVRR